MSYMDSTVICIVCKNGGLVKDYVRLDGEKYFCKKHYSCRFCYRPLSQGSIIVRRGITVHKKCYQIKARGICPTCLQPHKNRIKNMENTYCSIACAPCYFCRKSGEVEEVKNPIIHRSNKRLSPKKSIMCHMNCYEQSICHFCKDPIIKFSDRGSISNEILGIKFNMHLDCADGKTCYNCSNIPIVPSTLFPSGWTYRNHKKYPVEIRRAIFSFYLVAKRVGLYRDVTLLISSYIGTPDGWPVLNNQVVGGTICTPWLCRYGISTCTICDSNINVFRKSGDCTQSSCSKFALKCHMCGELVEYGSDPRVTCTYDRCIYEKCSLCNGEITYGDEDNRNLCTKTICNIYIRHCYVNQCTSKIRREPIDSYNECTEYRCVKSRCMVCVGLISPFPYGDKGCLSASCNTKRQMIDKWTKNLVDKIIEYGYKLPKGAETSSSSLSIHAINLMSQLYGSPLYIEFKELYDFWKEILSTKFI